MPDPVNGQNGRESISVVTRWFNLQGKGPAIFPWVLVAVLLYGLFVMVQFSLAKWGTPINLKQELELHREEMRRAHEAVAMNLRENTYVLSMCLSRDPNKKRKCDAIELAEPPSMRPVVPH